MEHRDAYINALQRRLEELRGMIGQEKLQVRRLVEAIGKKEEQVGHILRLLTADGVKMEGENSDAALVMSVSDVAYEVLKKQTDQKPVHYREFTDLIMAEGKLIPGRDPAANLISHLVRDDRFTRTGRGMYALTEWGLRPAKKRRAGRRSRSNKRRVGGKGQ